MIELRRLTKAYGLRRPTLAVNGVSLSVRKGAIFSLLGPKGAGKTTLIRILATVLRPTSGEVEIGGMDILSHTRKVRELIGFAPDGVGLAGWRSGEDFLNFWGRVDGLKRVDRRRRIREVVDRLELEEELRKSPGTYPVGVVRRLVLAQALLTDPRVVLLDEPMRGLSATEKGLVAQKLITMRKEGMTILMTSESLADVRSPSDLVAIMAEGRTTEVQEMSALIRTIGQGRHARIFLEADDLGSNATSALNSLKGVVEVRSTPTVTVIYVEPGTTGVEAIREVLEREGVRVRRLREAEMTLGDVFRALEGGGRA